ncbi:hypothetical protein ABT040_43460 [Streptomyces sp. NPDC002688]|uniref:hypothetical protein n=1 Tax=Streptomyces sp. NPDC002688 TaxID=3154423 RepID=UPI003326744E
MFFDQVVEQARDDYDLFCVNLYGDPHDIPEYVEDARTMMRVALLDYDGTELTVRRPWAHTFALLAAHPEDVDHVRRVAAEHSPDLYLFEVERHGQGPLEVMWTDGDVFTGEERPASWIERPWPHADAHAVDAFGTPVPVERDGVLVRLRVSVTPVFLSGGPAPVPESGRSLR